ncbi:MAG: hypothetical protein JSV36_17330 [Anaerolineae bacterium]|nr:MAG: hypothetical protein JSV36_17330 [Anaerolineae bacterium]
MAFKRAAQPSLPPTERSVGATWAILLFCKKVLVLVLFVSASLTACDTLEVGIERTAIPDGAPPTRSTTTITPEQNAEATVAALATENARLATQVAAQTTLTPIATSTPTPTPYMDVWNTYSNPFFAVSLEYPDSWQPVPGYGLPEYGETKFAGDDGFFSISAERGPGIDAIAAAVAGHKLRPYGSEPIIESLQIQGQEARLILPSADQHPDMNGQTELIVHYPQPVNIGRHTYPFFTLAADQGHIRAIAQTLRFTAGADSGHPEHMEEVAVPVPTDVLSDTYIAYTDSVFGISLHIPLGWETDMVSGAVTRFFDQDPAGVRRSVLTLSALNPESNSLEAALKEVKAGVWGSYIRATQSVQLGTFEALRLELTAGELGPPVIWLAVTPSGRAVGFVPGGDLGLIEAVLDTLRPAE